MKVQPCALHFKGLSSAGGFYSFICSFIHSNYVRMVLAVAQVSVVIVSPFTPVVKFLQDHAGNAAGLGPPVSGDLPPV